MDIGAPVAEESSTPLGVDRPDIGPDAARQQGPTQRLVAQALILAAAALITDSCAPRWKTLEPAGARFAIAMPGNADCVSDRQETMRGMLAGRTCTARTETWSHGAVPGGHFAAYFVSWFECPSRFEPQEALAFLEDLKARTVTGDLQGFDQTRTTWGPPATQDVSETVVLTMDRAEAIEFKSVLVFGDSDGHRLERRERMWIHGQRVFRAGVIGDLAPNDDLILARFFGSFRFIGEGK